MEKFLKKKLVLWSVNLALFAVLGYIAAGLLINDGSGETPTVTPPAETLKIDTPAATNPPANANNDLIINRDMFGAAAKITAKPEQPKIETPIVKPVPKPELNLKLIATIAGDRDFARAVIQNTKSKKQNLYKTGDVIDGATIERIERNTITIAFAGNKQTLNISAPLIDPTLARHRNALNDLRKRDFLNAIKITSPTSMEIDRNSKLVKSGAIHAAFGAFQAIPTEIDEKTKGLRITGLKKDSLARYVGIKNGDIITRINGQIPTNKRKTYQILKSAKKRSRLSLKLLQGDKEKNLSFKMI